MQNSPSDPAAPIRWRRFFHWAKYGLLVAPIILLVAYLALPLWVDRIAGSSDWTVLEGNKLSPEAEALVKKALEGLEGETLLDVHMHLAGRGLDSECWVHPDMLSRWHPFSWARFQAYLSAARMAGDDPDAQFAKGAIDLVEAMPLPVRAHFLALDFARDSQGAIDRDGSAFYVPDAHVAQHAELAGEGFVPAFSIHPRDPKALERLQQARDAGVRLIKWLPAAQNIDPADPSLAEFYTRVRELDLALLVHCGSEHAVETGHAEDLGNPLRLRFPLGQGVRIVVAHCASSGSGLDLDAPAKGQVPSHLLFLRLMDEPQYEGLLYGDISTVEQVNHYEHGLADLLQRRDLHHRFLHGSDWPLPAINVLYQLGPLARAGFLDPEEREVLAEIFDHNPLLYNLVLKRRLRHPESGMRFANEVFAWREGSPW